MILFWEASKNAYFIYAFMDSYLIFFVFRISILNESLNSIADLPSDACQPASLVDCSSNDSYMETLKETLIMSHPRYTSAWRAAILGFLLSLLSSCTEESKSTHRQYVVTPQTSSSIGQNDAEKPMNLVFLNPQEDLVGRGIVEIEIYLTNPPKDSKLGFYYVTETDLANQKKDVEQALGQPIIEDLDPRETQIEWDQSNLDRGVYYVYAEITSPKGVERFILDVSLEISD